MDKEIIFKTYGSGTIYLDEGVYYKQDLIDLIDYFTLMEERAKQLTKDMVDNGST